MNFQTCFYVAILASILSSSGCEVATQLNPQLGSTQVIQSLDSTLIFELESKSITDQARQLLASLLELKVLSSSELGELASYEITTSANGLSESAFLTLEELNPPLAGCSNATDEILREVIRLRGLVHLSLFDGHCTPAGFLEISKLINLESLALYDTDFTADHAKALAGVPNLKMVYVSSQANIRKHQKEMLRASLPSVSVIFGDDAITPATQTQVLLHNKRLPRQNSYRKHSSTS